MSATRLLTYIFVMAIVTYLIRMLPLVIFKKRITNKFIRSFLFYVPYAVLSAMTFPAIIYSGGHILSGAAGLFAALIASYKEKPLFVVALIAWLTVILVELGFKYIAI